MTRAVAASSSSGGHRRDFIFHVAKDISTGKLLVAGSNNTNFAPRQDLENINHYEVTSAGWYTLRHTFRNEGGVLAVDLQLLDANGVVLFTETRSDASDLIWDTASEQVVYDNGVAQDIANGNIMIQTGKSK